MATVFGQEERDLYNAFFIPDTAKRRAALEEWIKSTTLVIQAAVTQELDDLVEFVTENRWRFIGEIAIDMEHYIGKSVASYITPGSRNPIKYVNCKF